MSADVVPMHPVVRERVILHVLSSEISLAGLALQRGLLFPIEEGCVRIVIIGEGTPDQAAFQIRRTPASIHVWSEQVDYVATRRKRAPRKAKIIKLEPRP